MFERYNSHKLQPLGTDTSNNAEGHVYHNRYGRLPSATNQDDLLLNESSYELKKSLGKPTAKRRLHVMHALAASLSLICMALAIASVADERLSWRLGVKNHQLIVLGFLLSIMNLCLASVSPNLFLLLEARFGSSTLQNYEGILRNQIFSSKLTLIWRLSLLLNLALPLALGVAYKTFTGGTSELRVDAATYSKNISYYGMFAPPGLQTFGGRTGASLFANATQQFVVSSSAETGSEPVPKDGQAYGFNLLSLNNESTAMLDIPQPSYITNIRNMLAGGESWTMTAPVFATVATFNDTKIKNRKAFKSDFLEICAEAEESSGAKTHQSMMNSWAVNLIDRPSPGNQSVQYIALADDPGIQHEPDCSDLVSAAQPYYVNRQLCQGTWTITRGGIQLDSGLCNGTILDDDRQLLITDNALFLGVWYMSSLVEFLGPFATTRNNSVWTGRYFATATATMLYSRITMRDSASNAARPDDWDLRFKGRTISDLGLIYPVNETATYTRPTLRRSGALYFVLAIQPVLTVLVLILLAAWHSTPVGKNFGLISILSGTDRRNLDLLHGAALSGELAKRVQLVLRPGSVDGKSNIRYDYRELDSALAGGHRDTRGGKLDSGMVYH